MKLSKKVTRPTTRTPAQDADPVGLLPALYAKLAEAYYAQLRAFLRKFTLVRFEPAVHRRIVDAGTNHGGPVSFPATLTVYPRDAKGFARVVGRLETPVAELWDDDQPEKESDAPEQYVTTIFGEQVPASLLKTGRWRRIGRRR
jgi:hypothetical protein